MTLIVDVVEAPSGAPVELTKQAAAKAWLHYDHATGPSIVDSFNISSVLDNATGNYRPSLTNAMSDSNFVPMSSMQNGSGGGRVSGCNQLSSSSWECVVRNASTAALVDSDNCYNTVYGDLA